MHYGGQHEVQRCECANDYHKGEKQGAYHGRDSVLVIVHQLGPAFERNHLENGQAGRQNAVKVCDVVVYHLYTVGVVVLDGIETIVTINVAALSDGASA